MNTDTVGDAKDMIQAMTKISQLPPSTLIYCGHEYTRTNVEFAISVRPGDPNLVKKLQEVKDKECTIPGVLEQELKCNPFMIEKDVDKMQWLRDQKNKF